jgi:hypothetical protein
MVRLDVVDLDALNVGIAQHYRLAALLTLIAQKTLTAHQPALPAPVQSSPPLIAPAPVTPTQNTGQLLQNRDHFVNDLRSSTSHAYPPSQQVPVPPQDFRNSMVTTSLPPGVSQELLNSIPEDQRVNNRLHARSLRLTVQF